MLSTIITIKANYSNKLLEKIGKNKIQRMEIHFHLHIKYTMKNIGI